MLNIKIAADFLAAWSEIKLACILCNVNTVPTTDAMWNAMDKACAELRKSIGMEQISQLAAVSSSRKAYRALGKDPARYRLSAESLLRRIVKGQNLYRINNVVDALNLLSVQTGFSIGGYDFDKIHGEIELGIGKPNEPYEGIGRGELNIENLPVLRDGIGSFGSPTSDSLRTSVNVQTNVFLMVIFGFGAHDQLDNAVAKGTYLLQEYAAAQNIQTINIEK